MSEADNFHAKMFRAPLWPVQYHITIEKGETWVGVHSLLVDCLHHVIDIAILDHGPRCFILHSVTATRSPTTDNVLSGTMYFLLLDIFGNAHLQQTGTKITPGLGFAGGPILEQIFPLTRFEAFQGFEEQIYEAKNKSTTLPKKGDSRD